MNIKNFAFAVLLINTFSIMAMDEYRRAMLPLDPSIPDNLINQHPYTRKRTIDATISTNRPFKRQETPVNDAASTSSHHGEVKSEDAPTTPVLAKILVEAASNGTLLKALGSLSGDQTRSIARTISDIAGGSNPSSPANLLQKSLSLVDLNGLDSSDEE